MVLVSVLLASALGMLIIAMPVQASTNLSLTTPDQYYNSAFCGGVYSSSNSYYYGYSYDYYYGYPYYSAYPYSYPYSYYYANPSYQLTINSNPTGMSVTGAGQYCQGQMASFSVSSTIVNGTTGVRYVFVDWQGDYSGTSLSGQVTMNASKTVTAVYKTQYLLTVKSQFGNTTGSGWYDANSNITVALNPTTYDLVPGVRATFTGWSGDINTQSNVAQLTVNGPKTVNANFKTQYLLTVNSAYGQTAGSGWYDQGNQAFASLNASTVDIAQGVRSKFTGWSGDVTGTSIPIELTMTGPKTVMAQWGKQYYVSVSSPVGQATGSGWYDEGSTATVNVESPVAAGYGSKYVFQKWVGTTEIPSNQVQVQVNGPISLEATWNLDRTQLIQTVGGGAVVVVIVAVLGIALARRRGRQTANISSNPSFT